MKVLREFFFFAVSFLIISLAACATNAASTQPADQATPEAPVATAPVLTENPESPTEAPHLTLLAQNWLADQLGVPPENVTLSSVTEQQWSDSCLGLGQANESCLAAITPGWRMDFTVNGQPYEVRSDQSGQALRLNDNVSSNQPPASNGATPQQTPAAQSPAGAGVLENTQWMLVSMGPPNGELSVADGSPVTLGFQAQGKVGGNASCNSYGGSYTETGDLITFSELISTMKACADPTLMDREQQYLSALQGASRFEITGDQLKIYYNNDQGVLTFNAVK